MKIFLTVLGRTFAILPRCMMKAFCHAIGWLIATFPSRRQRALLANIYRCFPHYSRKEIYSIALDSSIRTVEMGLFVLASPYISEKELKSRIIISDFVKEELKKRTGENRAMLLLVPHFCMMEAITLLPMLSETPLPRSGVFYRPFDNAGMEEWIRSSREKYGVNLLSRRDGLMVALDYLRNKECIAVLFDQNSRDSGTLTMFFDRICATSEIAGILAERTDTDIAIFYARRTGFWRAEINGEYFEAKDQNELIFKSNDWLENTLKTDHQLCRDWLWLHKRWKVSDNPHKMCGVTHKNIILDEYIKFKNYGSIPRKTSFIVRAPHSFAEILEFVPAFRALHASRYDAHFTIIADENHADFLRLLNIAENVIETPKSRSRLKKLRDSYIYAQIMFADEVEDDKQSKAIRPDFSLGMVSSRKRKNIRYCYPVSANDLKLPAHKLYEVFLRHFGMLRPFDFTPIKLNAERSEDLIAVCPNAQESMGISEWKILLREISNFMPDAKFAVIHTNTSAPLAAELSNIFADRVDAVINASESLKSAALKMAQCRSAAGSEPLLLKMANLLSVPCVQLGDAEFIFETKHVSLKPDADALRDFTSFTKEVCTEISLID